MISGIPQLPQPLTPEAAVTPQPESSEDFVSLLHRGPAAHAVGELAVDEPVAAVLPADDLASSVDFISLLQQDAAPLQDHEPVGMASPLAASAVSEDGAAVLMNDLEEAPVTSLAPVFSAESLTALGGSVLQQQEATQPGHDQVAELTSHDPLSLAGLHAPAVAAVAAVSLPVAEGVSALSRVLQTPPPEGDEATDAPQAAGDTTAPASEPTILELADPMQPQVVSTEPSEAPLEVVAETSRASSETRAALSPPEPLDVVRAAPPDDTHLRFQRLTHDQLTLRIEDADGAMDVEVSREQAALQVRIVAPVEAIPELMGLGNAIEGALLALGLELGSYTTASRDDELPEADPEDGDDEGSESEAEAQRADPDRLLDMVI